MHTLKVEGTRGAAFYRPQHGEAAAKQLVRLMSLLGKPITWSEWSGGIGSARAYDEAANTMPKPASEQFADYIRPY